MIFSLRRMLAVARKEVRHLLRDPRMRPVIFIAPMVQMTVLGFAANFDVVDHAWTIPFPSVGTWILYEPILPSLLPVHYETTDQAVTVPAGTALVWFREDGTTGVPLD